MHSLELLFDDVTDAAIRDTWERLSGTGVRSARGRPHVTLTVAPSIASTVDPALAAVAARLPLAVTIGAPLLFGSSPFVLARLVVPSPQLLEFHAVVDRLSADFRSEPVPHSAPGAWTPHVTLARGLTPLNAAAVLVAVAGMPSTMGAHMVGLRRWDGDQRVEYPLG